MKMNKLQETIIVMLGNSEERKTGYDMAKFISDKTGNSHQQVYRELRALHSKNLLSMERMPQEGKPDKKMYSLMLDGMSYLPKIIDAEVPSSDFSKTNGSYFALNIEILTGQKKCADYIEHMQNAEKEFFDQLKNKEHE